MNNAPIGGRRPATEQPVGSGIWQTIRQAYDEIMAGAPMSYDIEGVPGLVGGRQRNYETAREACLTLKLAGQLPAWPRNQRVPLVIQTTNRTLRQERRLGREANLVLTLTPPPVGSVADLASVY